MIEAPGSHGIHSIPERAFRPAMIRANPLNVSIAPGTRLGPYEIVAALVLGNAQDDFRFDGAIRRATGTTRRSQLCECHPLP
jgi:hypothetical protein